VLLVGAHVEAGSWERAEESARELFSFCESRGSHFYSDRCAGFLATARLDARRVQDAIALFRSLIDKPDRLLGITARARLAHALVAADDLDSAMQEASRALAEGSWYPSTQPTALGALALIAMLRHDPADAFRLGERGLAVGSRGIWLRDGSILRLVRAEALHALGRREEAHAAIRDARDRVLGVVATLDDPELRHSYVTGVGANARTLRLAGEWLTQDAS
jgi:tetratricopeptide (TPR) repeat protein